MGYLVGGALGLVVYAFGRVVGFDRDRSFYPTVLVVVAWYYVLFAVMGGSTEALIRESVPTAVFMAIAVAGFKRSAWLVAAGLAGHGVFDVVHDYLIHNPGVPSWWMAFCSTIDVVMAAGLAWLSLRDRPQSGIVLAS